MHAYYKKVVTYKSKTFHGSHIQGELTGIFYVFFFSVWSGNRGHSDYVNSGYNFSVIMHLLH